MLLVLPVLWLLAWHSRERHTRRRLVGAVILRSIAITLLVVAVAYPRVAERGQGIAVVYALDVSRSVSPDFLARTVAWIRTVNERHRPAEARYVVFADRALVLDSLDEVATVRVTQDDRATREDALAQGITDIERALRVTLMGFDSTRERRLVLVTDGRQTQGDLWRVVPRLQEEGVRVFTVPAAPASEQDAWVEAIHVPPGVRQHEPVAVRVVVQSFAPARAEVSLWEGPRRLGSVLVELHEGANDVVFDTALPGSGATVLTAKVSVTGDRFAGNDSLSESVPVAPPPQVLYVEGLPESSRYLTEALTAHHIQVTAVRPEALVADTSVLSRVDAVILSDLLAPSLDARTVAALLEFVRERGGGLVFAAGESTFGENGFAGSAIEQALPVRFEARRKRRDLDLVLLIDRSHSMRGRKLELAKTAALSTLDLLERRHRLAVVAFDSRAHEVVPLEPVGNRRRAEDLISGMTARGQTSLHPALAEAKRLLAGSRASTRHVILLSDGITLQPPPGTADKPNAEQIQAAILRAREDSLREIGLTPPRRETDQPPPEPGAIEMLVAELALDGVTVSTVALGDKPNVALMRDIAAIGKGRGYLARDDSEIPGLFVKETRRLLGESLVEEPFRPKVVHRAAALAGLDLNTAPELRGMVVTRAKAFSDVVLRGPKDHPLLVTTQYGLGRSVAFLSDVKNRWASDWIGWDGYGRFWAQVVRDALPRDVGAGLTFSVTRDGATAVVEVRALRPDFRHRNGLAPTVRVRDPLGSISVLALRPVEPGRYGARLSLDAGRVQPYRFELLEGGGLSRTDVRDIGERNLVYAWSDEYRSQPADTTALRALSDATGGAFAPRADDIFAVRGDGRWGWTPMWPGFVGVALVLFLADLFWRRSPWFR